MKNKAHVFQCGCLMMVSEEQGHLFMNYDISCDEHMKALKTNNIVVYQKDAKEINLDSY